jgi:hypothetical protein
MFIFLNGINWMGFVLRMWSFLWSENQFITYMVSRIKMDKLLKLDIIKNKILTHYQV